MSGTDICERINGLLERHGYDTRINIGEQALEMAIEELADL